MKKIIIFLFLIFIGGAGYLHKIELLDDLPHVGRNMLKPSAEQPVDHFFYGLQSGELRFSGFAVDQGGRELIKELQLSNPDAGENPYLAAATCQLSYNILGHQLSAENSAKGAVQIELTMVPVSELIAATVVTGLGNIFSSKEKRRSAIIESIRKKGCDSETKTSTHDIKVINTPEGWKVSTQSLEETGVFKLIRVIGGLNNEQQ